MIPYKTIRMRVGMKDAKVHKHMINLKSRKSLLSHESTVEFHPIDGPIPIKPKIQQNAIETSVNFVPISLR